MGMFKKKNTDVKIALAIFNHYAGRDVNPFYMSKVNKIVKLHNENKKECLMEAIRLCGDPKTNDQLYIVAQCYVLAGADYRPQAIEFLNRFISAGAVWSGTLRGKINMGDHIADQLTMSKAEIWYQLGKAYEGEYQFENALSAYLKALEIDNTYTPAVVGVSDVYVKMNNIDGRLKFLREIKKSKYKDMKLIAKFRMEDLKEKKATGYVYRPRPRKRVANSSQPL